MVVLLSGLGASTYAVGATSGAIVGAISGIGVGLIGPSVGVGSASTSAGAIGASASAGAVLGTVVGKNLSSAIVGALSGTVTSAVASASVLGGTVTAASLPPGVGAIVLGTEMNEGIYTLDCWKPVLHDESVEPSNGKLLSDVIQDKRIKKVTTNANTSDSMLPDLILENIWDEQFRIDYLLLPPNQITAAHATKI